MLLTRPKENLVLAMLPRFPSKMVMVGVLDNSRGNMKYVMLMHRKEESPDQGGHPNRTQSTTQQSMT